MSEFIIKLFFFLEFCYVHTWIDELKNGIGRKPEQYHTYVDV